MSTATATATNSWPIIVAKVRKSGYRGRDSIDDVKAWIEKRYDAVTVNDQSISLDELEQTASSFLEVKRAAESVIRFGRF